MVVAEKPEYHQQTFVEPYSAAFAGALRVPAASVTPMAASERKTIARRAALELRANSVVNLGMGMPEGVAAVAAEEQVFALHEDGLALLEVAPGLDLQRDVLEQMALMPAMPQLPICMDAGIFAAAPMRVRARLLMLPLADRFTFDAGTQTMFINFERVRVRVRVRTADDVQAVRKGVEKHLLPLGGRVWGAVNYDHFVLDPEVQDEWAAMVQELVDRHSIDVVRYTTSSFLLAKLGPALAARGVAPHLYETAAEARQALPACTKQRNQRRLESGGIPVVA